MLANENRVILQPLPTSSHIVTLVSKYICYYGFKLFHILHAVRDYRSECSHSYDDLTYT